MARPRTKNHAGPTPVHTPAPSLAERAQTLAQALSTASVDVARAVAHLVATDWWIASVKRAGGVPDGFPVAIYPVAVQLLDVKICQDAHDLGAGLAILPVRDAAAAIGRLYTHALPVEHRATNGVFYTPPLLVRRLLDQATNAGMDWQTGRALSPACGGGQFLVEGADRMVAALEGTDPAIIVASLGVRLRGWDIDPFAAWLAQVVVEAVLLPHVITSGKRLPTITEVRDSLLTSWKGHEGMWDLVMENPAFTKVKDTPEIRKRFARSLYGHPNLYGLFMDMGIHLAKKEGGIVAYLTPTSYLGGEYFKALRATLAVEAPPVSIDLVESRTEVFEDVLQEVALTVCKRGASLREVACAIVHVEPGALRIEAAGALTLPVVGTEPWLMPRGIDDIPLVAAMQDMPTRLADYGYRVRTGPLVWNRHRDRLHDERGKDRIPVVWSEAVTSAGRFALKADKANHRAFYEPKEGKDSNLVREPCLLLQRTTAKEQSRRLIGALMPASLIRAHGAVAVENHLNMIVASKEKPPVSLKALAKFFASDVADRVIRCINASVAVSATELEAMPLPAVSDLIAALAAPDSDSALRRLYGI